MQFDTDAKMRALGEVVVPAVAAVVGALLMIKVKQQQQW